MFSILFLVAGDVLDTMEFASQRQATQVFNSDKVLFSCYSNPYDIEEFMLISGDYRDGSEVMIDSRDNPYYKPAVANR
jgi:hypothetical protein